MNSLHIHPGYAVKMKTKNNNDNAKLALCILFFTGGMFLVTLVSLMLVLIVLTK